jgi:hypothetical protein
VARRLRIRVARVFQRDGIVAIQSPSDGQTRGDG